MVAEEKGRALYYARLRRSYSDRVVVFSAGPGSHPIGEFYIDIARPRDVAEVRVTPRFIELHNAIWADLREEVLKGYENQRNRVK